MSGRSEQRPAGRLRSGFTTGACASAAFRAAYGAWLGEGFADSVTIRLPRGEAPRFVLAEKEPGPDFARAGIIKDAGDDPDVTHGALIRVEVRAAPAGSGVQFRAGEGVGTVTLPGLPIPPGEAAINPVPRRMMSEIAEALAAAHGRAADIAITVSIPGGEALAKRTLNHRLGIVGGLSILGTTGIVVPYSCSAWIHSIHQGIDVARALGLRHIAGATGRVSEAAVAKLYGLPETALIEMGDFVGGLLKYLRSHPVPRLTIAGGFGKIAKLASGALDLHSARSEVDRPALIASLSALGASPKLLEAASHAPGAAGLLALAGAEALPLGERVAKEALGVARAVLDQTSAGRGIALDLLIVDRAGAVVGRAGG